VLADAPTPEDEEEPEELVLPLDIDPAAASLSTPPDSEVDWEELLELPEPFCEETDFASTVHLPPSPLASTPSTFHPSERKYTRSLLWKSMKSEGRPTYSPKVSVMYSLL
jgi:hypothetical protein